VDLDVDPDANLEEQRKLAGQILELANKVIRSGEGGARDRSLADYGFRLAELVDALDVWMSGGGFSPWRKR
jgi:hypothetical protein